MNKKIINFLATGAYVGNISGCRAHSARSGVYRSPICSHATRHTSTPLSQSSSLLSPLIISGAAEKNFGEVDPGRSLSMKYLGFTVAFFLIPFTLINVIIVFLLFRFFDILKPFPIKHLGQARKGRIWYCAGRRGSGNIREYYHASN